MRIRGGFHSVYLLPPFVFADNTFNTIYRTVRASDCPASRDMISLHQVTSYFSGAARGACHCGPLERFRCASGIKSSGNMTSLFSGWHSRS